MFLRNKIQTVTSTRMGPRLISKNLAKANEKKKNFIRQKGKKEEEERAKRVVKALCSSACAFLSPWRMGLINFIEFALICGGPLAGQRLTRPQIVFSILGPQSHRLAFLSIDESPLFKVLCHVSHFFVFDLSSESIFLKKRKLSRNNICKGLTITYSQALIIFKYIYIYIKENIKRTLSWRIYALKWTVHSANASP